MCEGDEIGGLEVYAKVARVAGHFLDLCAQECPKAAFLEDSHGPVPEELPDNARVSFPIRRSMASVFQCIFVLARACTKMDEKYQRQVALHVCVELPEVEHIPSTTDILAGRAERVGLDFRRFFSAVFEGCVFASVLRAGLDCGFVPKSKTEKTPDLFSSQAGVYIECKDSLSDAGYIKSDADVFRKFHDLVRDGDKHFSDIDPAGQYEHVIVVDLPEGSVSSIKDRDDAERRRYMQNMFNLPYVEPDGTFVPREPIIDNPARVLMSDFDFGIYADRTGGDWPREPLWLERPFDVRGSDRLETFVQKFLYAEGGRPEDIDTAPR